MRWAGHVAHMGEKRKVCKVLVRKSEGKRPLGKPRRRWEDEIRMDLGENGWGVVCGLDSTGSGQEPVAGCCECGDEPSGCCATDLISTHFVIILSEFLSPCHGVYTRIEVEDGLQMRKIIMRV
jgi:hypothetical protein